ncbi:05d722bb-c4e7-41e9-b3f8-a7a5c2e93032 [Thermothielavioides terrestris]|uniref:05d722bb-c4e7-41e9-b3f8-a7a5c2e93032 n=1 Tax=Thermothielavioides terrestris TaxID=2587410 RepID=A0A3S4AWB6_9PEZI|nr:05d722bb-c4e7-41e9-b3f8-a7a5c2e93032 [Thermothielavioides terrestris]
MASKSFYAVVAGVGAGTGRSVALRFARAYPVVLLARNSESYADIVAEIRQQGGEALGISTDTADPQSVASAFETIKKEFAAGRKLAAAIYNVGAGFAIKPFLEVSVSDLDASLASNARGLFNFAQATLPSLLDAVPTSPHPPSLIITGATASVRGSARFGTFAAGKFAVRALGQSLAREFGPRGVHVAHVIVDGVIDIPRTKGYTVNEGKEDGKISPDAIAESYWHLHTQHRSSFTQELDLRPYVEKF